MTDVNKLITDNIDVWTSAIKKRNATGRGSNKKIELTGIKKLRELILELAVRGKLVPQDPSDEPASLLLEKIAEEKAQLIADKKIKNQKAMTAINNDEKPFALPIGWEWGRVGDLSKQVTDGVHHTPKYIDKGVPFISVKDIDGSTVNFSDCKYISEEQHIEINKRCNPEFGDVLLCRIGTLGRATIVDTTEPFSLFVSVGLIKFFQPYLTSSYLHSVFHSPLLTNQYQEIKAGGSHTNKLNLGDIPQLWIPVAPLAEQHRIVAKVDELMALCDQLEQQTEQSLTAHQTLVEVLLASLTSDTSTDANNKEDFQTSWQRIAEHFDVLFTTEASIEQLKQTILQLAVMGHLYSLDDKFQISSLANIEFPTSWAVNKLFEVSVAIADCPHSTPKWTETGVICVRTNQFKPRELDLSVSRFVSKDTYNDRSSRLIPSENDILYSREGGILGIACRVPANVQLCLGQRMMIIRANDNMNPEFLEIVLNSPLINDIAREKTTGGAAPRVNVSTVKAYPIPVPSLDEQGIIVSKVNELMALCEGLKARLSDAQTTQLHLADAVVENALDNELVTK